MPIEMRNKYKKNMPDHISVIRHINEIHFNYWGQLHPLFLICIDQTNLSNSRTLF